MHRKMLVGIVVLYTLLAMPFTINTGNAVISTGNSNPAVLPGPAQTDEIETLDDRFAAVARQVPGFGGMFFDRDGTLQVYLLGQKDPVDAAFMAFLDNVITTEIGRGNRLSQSGVEVREGQYDFLDLHRWRQQVSPSVLALPEVVFTDIDEATNRLRIGITDSPGMTETVEEYLAKLGVPREAVLISKTEPVWPQLRSVRRPLRGGFQINFGGSLCTLGFIAVRQGITGFVTASHCTNTQGGVEGTVYHQPTASGTTNRVGEEIADPTYFTGGACPSGRRCRFSDSSFARVPHPSGPAVTTALGIIARPPDFGWGWNGISIYQIIGEGPPLVIGQVVEKVGRTTGRTGGGVQQTCADFNQNGSNITQLCQYRASYADQPGDSGSAVFTVQIIRGDPVWRARLRGIHWGSGGVFSPIENIQMAGELGPLNPCTGGGC
jgi:hypothetical protein